MSTSLQRFRFASEVAIAVGLLDGRDDIYLGERAVHEVYAIGGVGASVPGHKTQCAGHGG